MSNDTFKKNQFQYWEKHKKRRSSFHPVIKAFAKPKIDWFVKYINLTEPFYFKNEEISLLDVGSGSGYFIPEWEKHIKNIVALDFSSNMLKQNPCPQKIQGDASRLPFSDDSFDMVFCSNLLHHAENPIIFMDEMRRVSRRFILICEPNRTNPAMSLFSLLKKSEIKALKFSMPYLKNITISANTKILDYSPQGIILPNKTPVYLLPLLTSLEKYFWPPFYNLLIAEKCSKNQGRI